MQFDINKLIIDHLWAIIMGILAAYGFILNQGFALKQAKKDNEFNSWEIEKLRDSIECVKTKDLEAIKQFNDDRYAKMEIKLDRMFEKMDEVKKTVSHLSGYLMGLKDKEGQ